MEPFVKKVEKDGVETYRITAWEDSVARLSAGFSTRVGGVSKEDWASLNCALHVADSPQDVIENRRRLAEAAGLSYDAWTCGEQVHEHEIAIVTSRDRGRGKDSRETAIANKDALLTDESDLMLVSFYADCVPLYYLDPVRRAVGLAHAGWKGTAKLITARTVEAFCEAYGSDPAQLYVVIGPSIGSCCYEVDEKVIQSMRVSGIEHGWTSEANGRYMLDLKQINRQILIKAGILPSHIELTSLCTSCHVESFYSHRRDGGRTGRMASWIGMMKR